MAARSRGGVKCWGEHQLSSAHACQQRTWVEAVCSRAKKRSRSFSIATETLRQKRHMLLSRRQNAEPNRSWGLRKCLVVGF